MCDKTPYHPAPPTTCCHVRRDGRGCAVFDDQDCSGADDTQWCFMRCIVVRVRGTGMDFMEDKTQYREMGYKPRKPEELPEEKKEKKKENHKENRR